MSTRESRQGRVPIQLPLALILLGLATWAILLWRSDVRGDPLHLTVSGTVEGESVSVGSKVGGRLLAVHVQEGDTLSAGQLVAEFDVPELAAQRQQLVSARTEANALLTTSPTLATGRNADEGLWGYARGPANGHRDPAVVAPGARPERAPRVGGRGPAGALTGSRST